MIDIKLIRENKELVKENIKKKFQDHKLPLVDEVYELDIKYREAKQKADNLRSLRNSKSDEIGLLMREGKKEEASKIKEEVSKYGDEIKSLEEDENRLSEEIRKRMLQIPNIIADSVPIGKDSSENVEVATYGEKTKYSYEVPYHIDILEKLGGIDLDSARRVSGNGFITLLVISPVFILLF